MLGGSKEDARIADGKFGYFDTEEVDSVMNTSPSLITGPGPGASVPGTVNVAVTSVVPVSPDVAEPSAEPPDVGEPSHAGVSPVVVGPPDVAPEVEPVGVVTPVVAVMPLAEVPPDGVVSPDVDEPPHVIVPAVDEAPDVVVSRGLVAFILDWTIQVTEGMAESGNTSS